MKLAKGPRPWSIWAFAVILTASKLSEYIEALITISPDYLQSRFSFMQWNEDWVIVYCSAVFSIVLIPVFAIWGFANRVARLLVTAMLAFYAPWYGLVLSNAANGVILNPLAVANALLHLGAVGLLYLPVSNSWLSHPKEVDPAIFD